jgi:ABC-2 type transport system permease protein
MNTPADAMSQSLDSPVIPSAVMSATRPLYWSVRRELWEYRSIYIVPLAVAGLTLVGFMIATIGRAMSTSLDQRLAVLTEPYTFATALVMGTAFIVGIFYCLDALHGERRDRTILFWKSLPVSDLTTLLSKATIPFVVLPVIAFVITVVMQWIMLLLSSVVLMRSGLNSAALWKQLPEFQMTLLYHLLTVHVLWYAPIYAWTLLVSGWARRAAFLWASLPLLAIGVVEKIAFNTTHFAALIQYRFSGPENFDMTEPGRFVMDPMMHLSLGRLLATPGLWSGLVVAVVFLAAAVRLRSYQGPI